MSACVGGSSRSTSMHGTLTRAGIGRGSAGRADGWVAGGCGGGTGTSGHSDRKRLGLELGLRGRPHLVEGGGGDVGARDVNEFISLLEQTGLAGGAALDDVDHLHAAVRKRLEHRAQGLGQLDRELLAPAEVVELGVAAERSARDRRRRPGRGVVSPPDVGRSRSRHHPAGGHAQERGVEDGTDEHLTTKRPVRLSWRDGESGHRHIRVSTINLNVSWITPGT
eukprot:scaffold95643_cov58-Phaeocystis_antarctica.AAC.11